MTKTLDLSKPYGTLYPIGQHTQGGYLFAQDGTCIGPYGDTPEPEPEPEPEAPIPDGEPIVQPEDLPPDSVSVQDIRARYLAVMGKRAPVGIARSVLQAEIRERLASE